MLTHTLPDRDHILKPEGVLILFDKFLLQTYTLKHRWEDVEFVPCHIGSIGLISQYQDLLNIRHLLNAHKIDHNDQESHHASAPQRTDPP